jgi:hypothetical protein
MSASSQVLRRPRTSRAIKKRRVSPETPDENEGIIHCTRKASSGPVIAATRVLVLARPLLSKDQTDRTDWNYLPPFEPGHITKLVTVTVRGAVSTASHLSTAASYLPIP